MKRIEKRAKAMQMIYETPELREFVAQILLTEKFFELKRYTKIATYIQDKYHCKDTFSSICDKIQAVAYENYKPDSYDFLLSEIVNSEPEASCIFAMSNLYHNFTALDWNNFTSDASKPLESVKEIEKITRDEFKSIASKNLDI